MDLKVYSLDQIDSKPIERISTGIYALDQIYGFSNLNGKNVCGLPKGKISVWSGPSGIGKTRLCIGISLFANKVGDKVLTFQNEVSPAEFKAWIKVPVTNPSNFLVSNYSSLLEQIQVIKSVKPDLVIVDSMNMIDGFDKIGNVKEILNLYRETVREVGCHVIFIGHLNKMGETKGSNDSEYLADIIAKLEKHKRNKTGGEIKGCFYVRIDKNRYGRTGGWVAFIHKDIGIEYVTSSVDNNNPVEKQVTEVTDDFSYLQKPKTKSFLLDLFR